MNQNNDNPLSLSNQLCFALYSASLAMTRTYRAILDELAITYPQYLVLLILWEGDDRTLKEMGELLMLDSGTLTPLLKRLEAQGLVKRTRDPADERLLRVRLTAAGLGLRERALCIPTQIVAASGRTAGELAATREVLFALRDALNDAA